MYRQTSPEFSQAIMVLQPGEYFATDEDLILCTVLGSCVGVCLRDVEAGVSGLNHFMLPGTRPPSGHDGDTVWSEDGRYGRYAMDLLIHDMEKLGARQKRVEAKVFGGGAVLSRSLPSHVPQSNIEFVLRYLAERKIPILAQDLGGEYARKILFFAQSGKVWQKRIAEADPELSTLEIKLD